MRLTGSGTRPAARQARRRLLGIVPARTGDRGRAPTPGATASRLLAGQDLRVIEPRGNCRRRHARQNDSTGTLRWTRPAARAKSILHRMALRGAARTRILKKVRIFQVCARVEQRRGFLASNPALIQQRLLGDETDSRFRGGQHARIPGHAPRPARRAKAMPWLARRASSMRKSPTALGTRKPSAMGAHSSLGTATMRGLWAVSQQAHRLHFSERFPHAREVGADAGRIDNDVGQPPVQRFR